MGIRTEDTHPEEVRGTFSLLLYSGSHGEGLGRIAFLDSEEDRHPFEMYAPAFEYSIIKGIPGPEALARAEGFVGRHNAFSRSQLSKITDEYGRTLGFEVRPLYLPLVYGSADVLWVHYRQEGNRVIIRVQLIPSIERLSFQ
ncbi:MAG: hypothetical protein K8I29_13050 [Alphaproteobacteria bacterium]|uniref:Uncharacterized protein n=1 Tax=Candidatus Nitrobium versatile TaxID=2884831 RepID=A0A953LXM6_9BACT|nr:hypothetical protein [Candidatus Nitrobium versatile]